MECAWCESDQTILIGLPLTFKAQKLEREVIGDPEESICLSCVVCEMFDVMLDEKEE